jgi:integrase
MSEKRIRVWVQHFKDREHLVLQWLDPDTGRRKSKSAETSDPGKAEAARVDLESDLNNGRYHDAGKMPWERFRELFEKEYVTPLRKNTRRNYGDALDQFERLCSPKRLGLITVRTLSAFATELRKLDIRGGRHGMQESTVKVRLQFLRTALRWAVAQGLLTTCPAFPKAKPPDRKPQPVPVESFERLLDKAPDQQTRAYLLCGWLAGLRREEAFLLEREPADNAPYLDPDNERIVLPAGFVKGVTDQWVPLDPVLWEALDALPRHGRRVFHFVASDGSTITAPAMGARVIRLAKEAGVKLTMKTLRRGFACRFAGKVPAQVLQKLMRHADIKTTLAYYSNVDEAAKDAILGPGRNRMRNTRTLERPEVEAERDGTPCPDDGSAA